MALPIDCLKFINSAVKNKVLHPANIRRIGKHLVSGIGVGAYKVGGEHGKTHFDTITKALSSGAINLVETSTHYGLHAPGEAESMVGAALRSVKEKSGISREQIVVVTKIGHAERSRLDEMMTAKSCSSSSDTKPEDIDDYSALYKDIVPPARKGPLPPQALLDPDVLAKDVFHCLSPEFIVDEFQKSSARLLTKPDYVFLHNPEFYLAHALISQKLPLNEAWLEMYSRLENAFVTLEAMTQAGEISGYGVSGNFLNCYYSVTGKSNVFEALDLQRLLGSVADAFERKAELTKAEEGGSHSSTDIQTLLQHEEEELVAEVKRLHAELLSKKTSFFASKTGFVGIQAPLNLLEFGAAIGRKDVVSGHAGEPEIDILKRNDLAFIANRPLTAIPPPGLSVSSAGNPDWVEPAGQNNTYIEFRQAQHGKPQGTMQKLVQNIVKEEIDALQHTNDTDKTPTPLQQTALHCSLAPGALVLNGMRTFSHVDDALAVLKSEPLVSDGRKTGSRIAGKLQSVCEELGADGRGLWKR